MIILTLGAVLMVLGAVSVSFPELCKSLQTNDEKQWKTLGSPHGHSFADLGKSIGVFSWVLGRGYEHSANAEVVALGKNALKKALRAKYLLLSGAFLLVVGFFFALLVG